MATGRGRVVGRLEQNICISVEHMSYLLTGIITTSSNSSQEVFQAYVIKMFPQVFDVIDYNTWIAVLVLVINTVSTLTFCFSDQLIIMGSIALGDYFQSFNERMKTHNGKVSSLRRPDSCSTFMSNVFK